MCSGVICLAVLMQTRKLVFEVVWKAPKETCFRLLVLLPKGRVSAFHQLFIFAVFLQHLLLMVMVMLMPRQWSWSTTEKDLGDFSVQAGLGAGVEMLGCLYAGRLEMHSNSFDVRLDILYSFPRHRNWQGLKKNHWQEVHFLYCYLSSQKMKSFFT